MVGTGVISGVWGKRLKPGKTGEAVEVAHHLFVFALELLVEPGVFHAQGRLLRQRGDKGDFIVAEIPGFAGIDAHDPDDVAFEVDGHREDGLDALFHRLLDVGGPGVAIHVKDGHRLAHHGVSDGFVGSHRTLGDVAVAQAVRGHQFHLLTFFVQQAHPGPLDVQGGGDGLHQEVEDLFHVQGGVDRLGDLQQALEEVEFLGAVLIHPGVADGLGPQFRHGAGEIHLFHGELPGFRGHQAHDADDLALGHHGDGHQGGDPFGLGLLGILHAGVVDCIKNGHRPAAQGFGDTLVQVHGALFEIVVAQPMGCGQLQPVGLGVDQPDCGPFEVHNLGDLPHDVIQHFVHRQGRAQDLADLLKTPQIHPFFKSRHCRPSLVYSWYPVGNPGSLTSTYRSVIVINFPAIRQGCRYLFLYRVESYHFCGHGEMLCTE